VLIPEFIFTGHPHLVAKELRVGGSTWLLTIINAKFAFQLFQEQMLRLHDAQSCHHHKKKEKKKIMFEGFINEHHIICLQMRCQL
jgi:hypothetical protein